MRLNDAQKSYLQNAEPNAKLVRFGDLWGIVWQVGKNEGAPRTTWHGRLAKEVRKPSDAECGRFLQAGVSIDDLDWVITWTGEYITAKTRRAVVQALTAEALR